jgi:DNA polymerase III epsilon subunit family exonuclease
VSPCERIDLGNGSFAIACSRGRRGKPEPCKFCSPERRLSTKLCDGRLPNGKRCDKPICDAHAFRIGRDSDLCPACQKRDGVAYVGTTCGEPGCGERQFSTPSGVSCANGHGGAPALEDGEPPLTEAQVEHVLDEFQKMKAAHVVEDWTRDEFVVLDLETTGLDARNDRIVEVAVVRVRGLREIDYCSTLIDPEVPLSPKITEITGLRDVDLVAKPKFREVADYLAAYVRGRRLLVYNAIFDVPFLAAEFYRTVLANPPPLEVDEALDPLVWVRDVDKFVAGPKRHTLSVAAARWGVKVDGDPHRALTDCRLALGLARKLAETGRVPPHVPRLLRKQAARRAVQEAEFQRYRAGRP